MVQQTYTLHVIQEMQSTHRSCNLVGVVIFIRFLPVHDFFNIKFQDVGILLCLLEEQCDTPGTCFQYMYILYEILHSKHNV
jgi:hypothetical protein